MTPRTYLRSDEGFRSKEVKVNSSWVEKGAKEYDRINSVSVKQPSRKILRSTAVVMTWNPHQSIWSPNRHMRPGAEQTIEGILILFLHDIIRGFL